MIRYFAGHPTAANLLMVLLLAAGIVAIPDIRRETFPDFETDIAEVVVAYPGATPEGVEEAVCRRLEEAVEDLTDADEIRCEAREATAIAHIDMRSGGDIDGFLAEVKTEIEAIDGFPDAVEDPVVRQANITDHVISLAVTGPMSAPDLETHAETLKDRLLAGGAITRIDIDGFADRQFRVALDAASLQQYRLSVADIAELIDRQSLDLPSGTIETGDRDILVRFAEEARSIAALEDLVIIGGPTGAELTLGEIASVTERFAADDNRILLNGRRAAMLNIGKTADQDTLTVLDAVRAEVGVLAAEAPPGVELVLTRDIASIVRDRLTMLVRNGLQGIVLVFGTLWLFFSLRFSFWVALGLPASFAGSLLLMTMLGLSLNMITMVALLIAIGLIMDDSIVIAENIARHVRSGKKPLEAAVEGTWEVFGGVLSSFLTSISVFAPLAFLEGNIGNVLKVLPIVLITTLAVSLIEAFLILPHHLLHAGSDRAPSGFRGRFEEAFAGLRERGFGRLTDVAVRWRYLTFGLVIALFLVAIGLVAGGALKFRAFPALEGDVVETRILLPQGAPPALTEAVVDHVSAALDRVDASLRPDQPGGAPLVRNVLVRFGVNADAFETGAHVATVSADLLTSNARTVSMAEIKALWRQEIGALPDVLALTIKEPQIGPAGLPIEVRLQGEDLDQLAAAALDLRTWFAGYAGVTDLTYDLRPGKPEIRLHLREGAVAAGASGAEVARQVRAAFQGATAAEVQIGDRAVEYDVQLRGLDQDSLADLDYFAVHLPDGRPVPLSALAELERGRGVSRILRVDGQRTVTVRGEIAADIVTSAEVLGHTGDRFLDILEARYPDIDISLEGEAAEAAETGASLRRALMFGLFGIFLLLSFQFRSYIEPLIVMIAIPFGLIGVVFGHLILGLSLSMPSVMGFAALSGIVINDSILLITFIKRRIRRGEDAVSAARQASRDRFRPVLLTSLTTIFGMMPLLYETSLQAQVLKPLVASMSFGLLASTFLILVMIPALYAVLHDFGLTSLQRQENRTRRRN